MLVQNSQMIQYLLITEITVSFLEKLRLSSKMKCDFVPMCALWRRADAVAYNSGEATSWWSTLSSAWRTAQVLRLHGVFSVDTWRLEAMSDRGQFCCLLHFSVSFLSPWLSGLIRFLSHSTCWAYLAGDLQRSGIKSGSRHELSVGWTNGRYMLWD